VVHVGSAVGRNFLRRYAVFSGAVGVVFLAGAFWIIAAVVGDGSAATGLIDLAPLILVPPAQAISTRPTAILQRAGSWADVSAYRTEASLIGAGIGVPIVFASRSVVGASIAVAMSEVAYALLIWHFAGNKKSEDPGDGSDGQLVGYWSTYSQMSVFSVLGWLQSQSERGLLGAWAGTSALGTYSLGSAIGRSAGDAIAASQASVLRVELSTKAAHSDDEIRAVLARNLRVVVPIAAVSAVVVVAISNYALAPFLGPNWTSALQMVPILALTGVPMTVAASSAPVHVQRGRARVAYVGPAICLLFSPLVGLAAMNSLTMAAWTVLFRECILALTQSLLMGKVTPWREISLAAVVIALGSTAVLVL